MIAEAACARPVAGPDYWSWRCLRCDMPLSEHRTLWRRILRWTRDARSTRGDVFTENQRYLTYANAIEAAQASGRIMEDPGPTFSGGESVSQQITRLLGTDDWAILHSGHEMVTDVQLDEMEAGG